jgi:hypothetical protein
MTKSTEREPPRAGQTVEAIAKEAPKVNPCVLPNTPLETHWSSIEQLKQQAESVLYPPHKMFVFVHEYETAFFNKSEVARCSLLRVPVGEGIAGKITIAAALALGCESTGKLLPEVLSKQCVDSDIFHNSAIGYEKKWKEASKILASTCSGILNPYAMKNVSQSHTHMNGQSKHCKCASCSSLSLYLSVCLSVCHLQPPSSNEMRFNELEMRIVASAFNQNIVVLHNRGANMQVFEAPEPKAARYTILVQQQRHFDLLVFTLNSIEKEVYSSLSPYEWETLQEHIVSRVSRIILPALAKTQAMLAVAPPTKAARGAAAAAAAVTPAKRKDASSSSSSPSTVVTDAVTPPQLKKAKASHAADAASAAAAAVDEHAQANEKKASVLVPTSTEITFKGLFIPPTGTNNSKDVLDLLKNIRFVVCSDEQFVQFQKLTAAVPVSAPKALQAPAAEVKVVSTPIPAKPVVEEKKKAIEPAAPPATKPVISATKKTPLTPVAKVAAPAVQHTPVAVKVAAAITVSPLGEKKPTTSSNSAAAPAAAAKATTTPEKKKSETAAAVPTKSPATIAQPPIDTLTAGEAARVNKNMNELQNALEECGQIEGEAEQCRKMLNNLNAVIDSAKATLHALTERGVSKDLKKHIQSAEDMAGSLRSMIETAMEEQNKKKPAVDIEQFDEMEVEVEDETMPMDMSTPPPPADADAAPQHASFPAVAAAVANPPVLTVETISAAAEDAAKANNNNNDLIPPAAVSEVVSKPVVASEPKVELQPVCSGCSPETKLKAVFFGTSGSHGNTASHLVCFECCKTVAVGGDHANDNALLERATVLSNLNRMGSRPRVMNAFKQMCLYISGEVKHERMEIVTSDVVHSIAEYEDAKDTIPVELKEIKENENVKELRIQI